MPTRILLVDDHRILREGLLALLDGESDLLVVGEFHDCDEALASVDRLRPDVVVLGVQADDQRRALECTANLVTGHGVPVLAISLRPDQATCGLVQAGASGHLSRDTGAEEFVAAVRAVSTGGVYLSPEITRTVLGEFARLLGKPRSTPPVSLTERETEVLTSIARGGSTKEIAFDLNVSTKTIETHRRVLMEKLGQTGVAGLTRYAVRSGLAALDF